MIKKEFSYCTAFLRTDVRCSSVSFDLNCAVCNCFMHLQSYLLNGRSLLTVFSFSYNVCKEILCICKSNNQPIKKSGRAGVGVFFHTHTASP